MAESASDASPLFAGKRVGVTAQLTRQCHEGRPHARRFDSPTASVSRVSFGQARLARLRNWPLWNFSRAGCNSNKLRSLYKSTPGKRKGMRTITIVALMSAASIWGAQPDFFPLQVGNRWVLQTASDTPELLSIEILRSRVQNGEELFSCFRIRAGTALGASGSRWGADNLR